MEFLNKYERNSHVCGQLFTLYHLLSHSYPSDVSKRCRQHKENADFCCSLGVCAASMSISPILSRGHKLACSNRVWLCGDLQVFTPADMITVSHKD